jgi:hypothetical protein
MPATWQTRQNRRKILDFSPKSSFSPSSRPSGFLPDRVERDSIFSMSAGGGFQWGSMSEILCGSVPPCGIAEMRDWKVAPPNEQTVERANGQTAICQCLANFA